MNGYAISKSIAGALAGVCALIVTVGAFFYANTTGESGVGWVWQLFTAPFQLAAQGEWMMMGLVAVTFGAARYTDWAAKRA